MAIFLSMIATVFFQAGTAFSVARSSVTIHQNARAAFDTLLRDLAAAQLCSYEDKEGYFAISWEPDPEAGYPVQSLTFTTLAEQPGAESLVKGVSPQVALVRYTLRFNGGSATIKGDNPATTAIEDEYQVPTCDLIKQIRFPHLAYLFCDMGAFPKDDNPYKNNIVPDEAVTTDVVAIGVYDMRIRAYYRGDWLYVSDHGQTTGGGAGYIEDNTRLWTQAPGGVPTGETLRILGGDAAPQVRTIASGGADTSLPVTVGLSPTGQAGCTYRIEESSETLDSPAWLEPPDRGAGAGSYDAAHMYPARVIENISGAYDIRMPYLVEITLKMVDPEGKMKRDFIFTQRFTIPTAFE